jgi:hypothetical protein
MLVELHSTEQLPGLANMIPGLCVRIYEFALDLYNSEPVAVGVSQHANSGAGLHYAQMWLIVLSAASETRVHDIDLWPSNKRTAADRLQLEAVMSRGF